MPKEKREELMGKAMTELDGIESYLRQVWPDDRPAPTNKNDEDYWLHTVYTTAMVHLADLRLDLEGLSL